MRMMMIMITMTLYTVTDRLQEQESNWKQTEVVASMEQTVFAPPLTNGILYKASFGGEVNNEFYTWCNEFARRYFLFVVVSTANKTTCIWRTNSVFYHHMSADLVSAPPWLSCKMIFGKTTASSNTCMKYGTSVLHLWRETLHHLHDVNTMLRVHCIAHQFQEYWLDSWLPAIKEAELIIMQCRDLLKNQNDVSQNMCIQFQESGDVIGYRLFKLSQSEFEDRTKWGNLIAVFAFSTKLMNREISDLISKWMMHVLLQNSSVMM